MLAWVIVLGAVAATPPPATGIIAGTVQGTDKVPAYVFVDDVSAPAAPGTELELVVRNKQYESKVNAIVAGTTARWINEDPIFHNAYSVTPGNTFDLGAYKTYDERRRTFTIPGVVSLYCNMHPQEVGHLLVVPSPLYAKVGPAGQFMIAGVPPGRHRLKAWMPNVKAVETTVDVTAGATTKDVALRLRRGKARPAPFLIQDRGGPGPTFPPRPSIP